MNALRLLRSRPAARGSALVTVLIFIAVMLMITGSLLQYTVNERRSNERNRLILRSRNMAENAAIYASEQLTTKLRRLRSPAKIAFDTGANKIYLPPNDVLVTENSTASDVEVKAGLTSATDLIYIDPKTYPNDPNKGLQVQTATVQIIAKSNMRNSSTGTVTTYVQQDLAIDLTPLFQFGVFYNMDMEYGPGPDMTITGPVHTNGNLIARMQTGKTSTLEFSDRVTAAGGFFAHTAYKGSTWMNDDSEDKGPGGTGALNFTNPSGTKTAIFGSSVWRDHFYTASSGTSASTPTATNLAKFQSFATTTYSGNLRTSVHGVTKLELPAIGSYDESTNPKGGREIIEEPKGTDNADMKFTKIAYLAGLYIIVNPDDDKRTGTLPDGSSVTMRPRSYRCWLNAVALDGTRTLKEVILPGQPSYGAMNANVNNLPNAYRVDTSVGSNQVLRIPKGTGVDLPDTGYPGIGFAAPNLPTFPALSDAYFYDLRRATNNTGHPWNRGTNNYKPRPIAKIDLDMTRFKMAVDRTYSAATASTVYYPSFPVDTTTWNASVLNASATAASFNLGLSPAGVTDYGTYPTYDTVPSLIQTQAAAFFPSALMINSYTQTGSGSVTALAARFVVSETTSPTIASATWTATRAFSTADESSFTYSPTHGTTFLKVDMYKEGTTSPVATNLCDTQIIPITPDLAPLGVKSADGTNARFIIAETTDAAPTATGSYTNKYTSSADEISLQYTPSSASVTAVRVRQYAPGGTSTLIREQFIPVAIAALTNDAVVVPTNSSGTCIFNTNTSTEMRVYVGGVDDTANWTITANSGSWTGSFGTGRFVNRYTVTALSANTVTVNLTATRTGFPTLTKSFTLTKQTAVSGLGNNQQGRWFAVNSQPAPNPFGIYFAPSDPNDTTIKTNPASFAVSSTDLSTPWFDGVTIYIHSAEAEDLSLSSGVRSRTDSGVRLWNGRGPVVSLTASGKTGCTICTNDAVYIVGHYNADGTINSTATDTTAYGGYSARYPDSASEKLCAVMGDGMTILSQPVYVKSGSNYLQDTGWCDSLSANRPFAGSYNSSWASTNPSSSNTVDGINTSITPAQLPNDSDVARSPGAGTGQDTKFDPTSTEISACLLTGIVRTTTNQTSGGVHNFPRLQEYWPVATLAIRGSMVALFESQVATEPWSIRTYQGAVRKWGLHQALRDAKHDVPLEPIVIGAHRLRYLELNPTQYKTLSDTIDALPH